MRKFIIKWQGLFKGRLVTGFKIADEPALEQEIALIRKRTPQCSILPIEISASEAQIIVNYLGDTFPNEII